MARRARGVKVFLAFRIFLIVLIILVIPLFIHTIIMYVHDYRVKTEEMFMMLDTQSKDEALFVDNFILDTQREMELVDRLAKEFPANEVLQDVVKDSPYTLAFYLSGKRGICRASSSEAMVGKTFARLIRSEEMAVTLDKGQVVFSLKRGDESLNFAMKREKFLSLLKNPYLSIEKPGVKKKFEREIPVKNGNFALVLKIPHQERMAVVRHHLGRAIEVFVFVVVIGGLIGLLLTFRMGRPYKKLGDVMGNVADGDLDVRYKRDRWGFEVNQLGQACNAMIESLLRHAEEVQSERLKSEALSKELIMGGDLQQAVVPREIAEFPEVKIATGFVSAKEVGGDFYDFFPVGDDKLFIVVGDAAGKGLFAGFFSLTLRGILRGLVRKEEDLGVIVREANELFCADTKESGVFVTAWFGMYDRKSGELEYVSCGHPPAFLGGEKLDSGGMALGVAEFEHVEVKKVEASDVLVVYSDGITEAHNENGEMYGEKRLFQQVAAGGDVVENVLSDVEEFEGELPRFDDQTIIQVTF